MLNDGQLEKYLEKDIEAGGFSDVLEQAESFLPAGCDLEVGASALLTDGLSKTVVESGDIFEFPKVGDCISFHISLFDDHEKIYFETDTPVTLELSATNNHFNICLQTMKTREKCFICHPKLTFPKELVLPASPPIPSKALIHLISFFTKLQDISIDSDDPLQKIVLSKGEGISTPSELCSVCVDIKIAAPNSHSKMLHDEKMKWDLFNAARPPPLCVHPAMEQAVATMSALERCEICLSGVDHLRYEKWPFLPLAEVYPLTCTLTLMPFENRPEPWNAREGARVAECEYAKTDGNTLFQRGLLKAAIKRYQKAKDYCTLKENLSPEFREKIILLESQIFCNIALCQLKLNKPKKCVSACDRALAVSPNNPKALYRKAMGLLALNDPHTAVPLLHKALEVNPDAAIQRHLDIALKRKESLDSAEKERCSKMFL